MRIALSRLLDGRRGGLNLTHSELAKQVRLSWASISRIMAGKQMPRPPALRRFALILALEPGYLLAVAAQSTALPAADGGPDHPSAGMRP